MSAPNAIKSDKLARLIGTASTPAIIDVRTQEDFEADPRLIPGAMKRSHQTVSEWGKAHAGKPAIVVCHHGAKLSEGTAAWLRQLGADAVSLEGGFVEWDTAKLPLVPVAKIPKRDAEGRTIWVTRARPKIDRIACPWLIRRFVDPAAVFLFVAPQEVAAADVRKSINFCNQLGVEVVGVLENMSGFVCPKCECETHIFSSGGGEKTAREFGVRFLGRIPIDPAIGVACDSGSPFVYTPVSYTHLRAHETVLDLVCRLLLEKKNTHR